MRRYKRMDTSTYFSNLDKDRSKTRLNMKVFVGTLVVLAFAYIYAEKCADNHECHDLRNVTICHHHTHVVCSGGWCTCTNGTMGVKCAQKSDCSSLNCPEHHDAHCVDSHCHCGMPANGGPGGPGGPGSHDGQH